VADGTPGLRIDDAASLRPAQGALAAKRGDKKSGQTDNRLHSGRLFAKL
jgi:hypothetical protein